MFSIRYSSKLLHLIRNRDFEFSVYFTRYNVSRSSAIFGMVTCNIQQVAIGMRAMECCICVNVCATNARFFHSDHHQRQFFNDELIQSKLIKINLYK